MKKAFRDTVGLNKQNLEKLTVINEIIEQYKRQGYKLTLRQLYYQLVSRDIVPNRVQEYQKLSTLLVKARMGGSVDWNAIEDRLPKLPYQVDSIPHAIEDTIDQYRLNRQVGQNKYIEVWCEKDALSNVLHRLTSHYHVRLMVNRGYSSCTAMYDAYRRLYGKDSVILYLGDHDPSGLDMIRDINDRENEFGAEPEVVHIALTREQINKYNPPPNPAKITDPRSTGYISEHGNTSWEVDALPPEVLHELLKENIEQYMDMDLFQEIIDQEEHDKDVLRKFRDDFEEEN